MMIIVPIPGSEPIRRIAEAVLRQRRLSAVRLGLQRRQSDRISRLSYSKL